MDLAEDMYREELLEYCRNPLNYGKLDRPSVKYHDFNPVCGDEVEVYLKIKNRKLDDVRFIGKGCAISQAAASLVTENVKKKNLREIRAMTKEEMLELLPVEVSNLRIKCALLTMKAIQKALVKYKEAR